MDHPEFYKSAFEHDPSDEPVQCEGARRKVIPKKGLFGKLGRTETRWVRCENITHTQLYGSTQYEFRKIVCSPIYERGTERFLIFFGLIGYTVEHTRCALYTLCSPGS